MSNFDSVSGQGSASQGQSAVGSEIIDRGATARMGRSGPRAAATGREELPMIRSSARSRIRKTAFHLLH